MNKHQQCLGEVTILGEWFKAGVVTSGVVFERPEDCRSVGVFLGSWLENDDFSEAYWLYMMLYDPMYTYYIYIHIHVM